MMSDPGGNAAFIALKSAAQRLAVLAVGSALNDFRVVCP